MSNNIYDILGKLNGLASKENPVSTAEPVYESVDPRGDILEAVTGLEKKYAAFNENVIAEKKKKKSAEKIKQPDAGDITSADAAINALLTKARFSRPGAKNDLEAIVYHIAKQDEELERAKAAEEEDRLLIKKAQLVTDQMNDRFRKLNAKVAAGEITAQDQEIAQAAQQIEKDADAAKAAIAADPTAPVQQIADPAVKTQKTSAPAVSKTEPEASNIYNFPTQEPAPVQTVSKPKTKTAVAPVAQKSNPLQSMVRQITTAPQATPQATPQAVQTVQQPDSDGAIDLSKFSRVIPQQFRQAAESLDEMSSEEQVLINFGKENARRVAEFVQDHTHYQASQKLPDQTPLDWKTPPPGAVKLDFPNGRTLNLSVNNVAKLLQSLTKRGITAKDRDNFFNYTLGDADQLLAYINNVNRPQPKRVPVRKGQTLDMFGDQPNQPHPYQQGDTQLEENLGNPSMKNLEKIAESLMERFMNFKEAAKPDFLDLDKDGDTEEPMKKAAKDAKEHEPAKPDSDAVAKRKRLQALKDKQEDERAEKDDYDTKSSTRVVKGRAYGGAAQKDDEEKDLDESGLQAYLGKKKYGKEGMKALQKAGREGASKEKMAMLRAKHDKMDEVAPPGAKAERMVKGIKKSLSKDGHLSGKDKAIAYATTWKAHNKGQVEEGTEFGDKIKNSKAELKKHKMVKEGRNPESSEYTYETVGRILSDEQPGLDCNSEAFVKAVYDELIEMKMTPKAARWLVHYDEDFISDCATSYSHFCDSKEKEAMECGAPMNSFVSEEPLMDAQQELDEIARLAGLTRENYNPMVPGDSASPLTYAGCPKCNADPCCCEDEKAMDEGMGCSEEELNEAATRKDFRMVADLLKSIPDMAKRTELAMYHADIFKQQNPRFKKEMFLAAAGVDTTPIKEVAPALAAVGADLAAAAPVIGAVQAMKDEQGLEEEEMGEGNEFSGALAKARAEGKKEFEVDGKKYTVKEDININVSANGEEDVVNLIRKLSGMPMVAIQAQPTVAEEIVAEEGPKERDVEYTNSPREEVAGTDAAIPAGADLNRAKRQYKKEYPGDNPMAESKEAALWKQYETMINDVKA